MSLGCPRNLLDSEVLLALLEGKGLEIAGEPEGSDIAIVNTCGFIQDAKEESIELVLQLAELKKSGKIKKLVVTGCLPQRYPKELADQIKEIDAVFGTSDFIKIPGALEKLFSDRCIKEVSLEPDFLYDHTYSRKILTPGHFAYVKIQEGCSNRCSYCVIPNLKGPRRSRSIESVLKEIETLKEENDIKELVLIGQDTTSFGIDRGGKSELARLLREVSPLMEEGWVRLLYTHPAHFTDELIETITEVDNICKYVDLPIQHASSRILKVMNRRVKKDEMTSLIKKLRERMDGLTLRTSVIVGFPGETDEEFRELLDYLEEIRFDRLGAFIYSREEGTPAFGFENQIPIEVKEQRFDEVMRLQQRISSENNLRLLESTVKVLIDEEDASGSDQFTGRSQMDAPEVDGSVYLKGSGKVGQFCTARITGSMEYDLVGEII